MQLKLSVIVGAVALLSGTTPALAELTDGDVPLASLLSSANIHLAKGDYNQALDFFDLAINKDPKNYLAIFKRGATYLSLGRTAKASQDFDQVLVLKPGFESALLQRAKIHSRVADWDAARRDYKEAEKSSKTSKAEELEELEKAEAAMREAIQAEKEQDFEKCVSSAGEAIQTASASLSLRQLRARCRLTRGEVHEAISDLTNILILQPDNLALHIEMTNLLFFSLGDSNRALQQIRKCLHSDQDNKLCKKVYRTVKRLEKDLTKIRQQQAKRQWTSSLRSLIGTSEEQGFIKDIEDEWDDLQRSSYIHPSTPKELLAEIYSMACNSYYETNSVKKGTPYCDRALKLNPTSLPALLFKAKAQLKEDLFEDAIRTLEKAKESAESNPDPEGTYAQKIREMSAEAQTLLRRSKEKDYYKVLGVPRDASTSEIKRAYRKLAKQYHPDKLQSSGTGMTKEAAMKKSQEINEAYEVLSDDELRRRFDSGDDPNAPQQNPFAQGGHPFGGHGGGQQFFFRSGGDGGGGFPFGHNAPGGNFHFKFQH